MLRERLDQWLEWLIQGFLLSAVVLSALALGAVRTTEFSLVVGLVLVALVVWILRLWISEDHRFLMLPFFWPLLVFSAYAGWRYTQAPVEYLARKELILLMVVMVILLLSIHNLHKQEAIQIVTVVLTVVGLGLAFYALIQLASGTDKVLGFTKPIHYVRRGGGTFINPNHLAGWLITVMPLAAAQVFLGRTKPLAKVFYGYAAMVMLVGIGVTMSRGGWLAAAIALSVFLVWLLRRRQYRIPALASLVVLLAGGAIYFWKVDAAKLRLTKVMDEGTAHAGHSRKYLFEPAFQMWRENLVWGVGPGQFDARFPAFRPPTLQVAPVHVHNEYLELLVDYGLVGAGLVVIAMGIFAWCVAWTAKHVERGSRELGLKASNRTAFFIGATVGLFGLMVHSVVEFHWHIPGVILVVALVGAVLASNLRFATERFWLTPKWWSQIPVTIGAALILGWSVPNVVRLWQEGRMLNEVAGAVEIDDLLLRTLRAATAIEPKNSRTWYELGENLRLLGLRGLEGNETTTREGIAALRQCIALDPSDARAHLSLALSHHWLREADESFKWVNEALRLGPNDVQIANNAGWLLIMRGDLDRAEELLQKSKSWYPWGNWKADDYLGLVQRLRARR